MKFWTPHFLQSKTTMSNPDIPSNPPEIRWVIPQKLARASRPGFPANEVAAQEVDSWISRAKWLGIRSVICFLNDEEIEFYYGSSGIDLLEYYRRAEFHVSRCPAEDHLIPAANERCMSLIIEALQQLPAPWVIHCSAGTNRTGIAVNHALRYLESLSATQDSP